MKNYFLPVSGFSDLDLDPSQILDLSNHLISAREKLSAVPVFEIVDWIDAAVADWCNPNAPIRRRVESQLPALCGLSKEMVQLILEDLFQQLTRSALVELLEAELGDPNLLDRFCPKLQGHGLTRAFGPRLITHILPGNIPGVSIVSLICGLLVKSANLMRPSHDDLLLTVGFAQSLQALWPEMAQSIGILYWEKALEDLTSAAFQKTDIAIVYGSDETIESLRKKIPPTIRAIYHGHKLSLGVIARETIGPELAANAAADIALYDQRGCLSPHLYYVESGGSVSPRDFSEQVATALDALSSRLPKGETSPSEAAQIQQIREALPLKGGAVFSSENNVDWTVLYDPEPTFTASPLSRTIWIKPVQDLMEVSVLLDPIRGLIQAIGIAVPEMRAAGFVDSLSKMGGCRICPIGEMQQPPLTWHHDGAFRLLPLLRFVDWEK